MNEIAIIEEVFDQILNELNRKGVETAADGSFIKHAKRKAELDGNTIKFLGFTEGMAYFDIQSYTWGNKVKYMVRIQFKDWNNLIQSWVPGSTRAEASTLASSLIQGGIKVDCNCPSFRYHYRYVAGIKDDSAIVPEKRPAPITNPKNRGLPCKHTRRIIEVANNWMWSPLVSFITSGGKKNRFEGKFSTYIEWPSHYIPHTK